MNNQILKGKNAVVTAGAHGLGFAVARLFAEQRANVAICARNSSGVQSGELLQTINPNCFFFQCDLGNEESVCDFCDAVIDRFGYADIIVNCVGVNGVREPVSEITLSNYDMLHRVNVKSSLVLLRKLLPLMIENGIHGSVVNVSSIHAVTPSAITGSYASTKGAVNALSRVLALEAGKYGIRSNTICPGWIATTDLFKDLDKLPNREDQHKYLEQLDGSQPLMSPARAEDIARHILFFASDMSRYITGATIMDDGASGLQTHTVTFEEPDNNYEMRCGLYDSILDSPYTMK